MAHKPALRTRYVLLSLGLVALVFLLLQLAIQSGVTPWLDPAHGVTWSLMRQAVTGKTVSVVYLWLTSLPIIGIAALSVLGLGWQVRRRLIPDTPPGLLIPLGLGLAGWLLMAWLLGLAGWLNAWSVWAINTVLAAMAIWHALKARDRGRWNMDTWPSPPWTLTLALPAVILLATAVCCPPGTLWSVEAFGYDVMSYHLQLPRQWMADGRIHGLEYQAYSYLPNLTEAGYLMLGYLGGRMEAVIYACAMAHALCAVLAAWALSGTLRAIVRQVDPSMAGSPVLSVAGILFLAMPWTLITASLAYDEMAAMALALVAWRLLIHDDQRSLSPRRIAVAGFLLGAAALAKLTVAAMLLPGLLIFAFGPVRQGLSGFWPRRMGSAMGLCAAMALAMAPYAIRNAIWTGNPFFPLATSWLGRGHWTLEQATRWQAAHQSDGFLAGLARLADRGIFSAGFASLGGQGIEASAGDVTHFAFDGGLPWLPLLMLVSLIVCLACASWRTMGLKLLGMLLGMLLIWAAATHHQSRFLLPTLAPMALLLTLGLCRLHSWVQGRRGPMRLLNVGVALLLLLVSGLSYRIFWTQTRSYRDDQGVRRQIPIYQLLDSLPMAGDPQQAWSLGSLIGDHVLNYLSPDSRTLMVADAGVLYVRSPIVYQSVFDADPLAAALNRTGSEARAAAQSLKRQGITHVWVHWSELSRLQETYGYDLKTPPVELRSRLALGSWRVVSDYGWATLYALP